jgi:putative phosphoesterase
VLLAIISDTHLPRGARTIPSRCLERCRAADAIIHAGDLADVPVLEQLRGLGPPLHAVRGNVDSPALAARLPELLVVTAGAVQIGVVHVPPRDRLTGLRSLFPDADAVVFGHTHLPEHARAGDFQIFNPGSPTERRRAPSHTMGLARVRGRRIVFELVELD